MEILKKHKIRVCVILFISFVLVFSFILAVSLIPTIIGNDRGTACSIGQLSEMILVFVLLFVFIPAEKKLTVKTGLSPLWYNVTLLLAAAVVSAVSLLSIDSWLAMIEPGNTGAFMENFLLGFGVPMSVYILVGGFVVMLIVRLLYELVLSFRE